MKKLTPVGKFHVMQMRSVSSSNGIAVPVLYFQRKDDTIFFHEQFHEYMLANPNTSGTWKRTRARALGFFWDFCQAIENILIIPVQGNIHSKIIRLFCQALQFGTIDIETKLDPYGLYWPSTNKNRAKELVSGLQDYITWVSNEYAKCDKSFALSSLTKLSTQDSGAFSKDHSTSTRFLIISCKLKEVSFFSHLKDTATKAGRLKLAAERRLYDFGSTTNQFEADPAVYMDSEIVAAMLQYGFVRNPDSNVPEIYENITAKMIFILLCFGGCRASEPFHLWFNDVNIDVINNRCKVFLRNPAEANTYFSDENESRREYLAKISLLPRNEEDISKSYHAGWKNLSTDKSHNAPIFWLHDGADALFAGLYSNYLRYRSSLMEQRRLRGLPDHPFLFVSAGEDRNSKVSKVGDPYSMGAFSKAWDQALKKISKVLERQIVRKKEYGTSEHATRHFYGQVLSDSGVHPKVIQKGLRHRSVLSQTPYTAADFKKVNADLQSARKKIDSGQTRFDLSKINNALASLSGKHRNF